jgi:hypothetical protein
MMEIAALLSFYLAFALVHGADPRRFPARRWQPTRGALFAMRVAAAATTLAGVVLWARTGDMVEALLVALAALSVAATSFVLLAPLGPRALWSVVLAFPLLIVALALVGNS